MITFNRTQDIATLVNNYSLTRKQAIAFLDGVQGLLLSQALIKMGMK